MQLISVLLAIFGLMGSESKGATNALTPSTSLQEGTYYSSSGYFQYLQIRTRGQNYLLSGTIPYGDSTEPFSVVVSAPKTSNAFFGSGTIDVQYEGGIFCSYSIDINLTAYLEGLYVESTMPSDIPREIIGNTCGAAGQSKNFIHKQPYTPKNARMLTSLKRDIGPPRELDSVCTLNVDSATKVSLKIN